MTVVIKDFTAQNKGNMEQKASIFLRFMAEHIVALSTPRTPKKTGRLRMDINKQILGLSGKIKWGKNYAIYQETKQFKNYTTPGTGPHYAEDSVHQGINETQKVAQKAGLI